MFKDKLVAAIHITAPYARKVDTVGTCVCVLTTTILVAERFIKKD